MRNDLGQHQQKSCESVVLDSYNIRRRFNQCSGFPVQGNWLFHNFRIVLNHFNPVIGRIIMMCKMRRVSRMLLVRKILNLGM